MSRTYRNTEYCGIFRQFKYKANIKTEVKAAEELREYRNHYTRNRCFVRSNLGSQAIPNPWNDYTISATRQTYWKQKKLISVIRQTFAKQQPLSKPIYPFFLYKNAYIFWKAFFGNRLWKPDKSKVSPLFVRL